MMNPIAEKLIHNLRHDAHTRAHFDMSKWAGKETCNTVGCITGTAIMMAHPEFEDVDEVWDLPKIEVRANHRPYQPYIINGMKILGIPFFETAADLFIPMDWTVLKAWTAAKDYYNYLPEDYYGYLPKQARPTNEHIEKMKEWAQQNKEGLHNITPTVAARGLELVTKDELPYMDWQRAFEEA